MRHRFMFYYYDTLLAIYFIFGWLPLFVSYVMDFSLSVSAIGGFGIHTRQWGIMVWQWHRRS